MDADDIALPDRLERQVALLEREPELAVVGGAATLLLDRTVTEVPFRPPSNPAAVRALLAERNAVIHPTAVVRSEALSAVGGYRAAFVDAEDYDLWLRISERWDITNLPDIVLHYRMHKGQTSHTRLEQQALSALAARVAAELRARGEDEAALLEAAPTEAGLLAMGVDPSRIATAMAESILGRLEMLFSMGDMSGCMALAHAYQAVAHRGRVTNRTRAAGALAIAKLQAHQRRPARTLRWIATASLYDPQWSWRILKRKVNALMQPPT